MKKMAIIILLIILIFLCIAFLEYSGFFTVCIVCVLLLNRI